VGRAILPADRLFQLVEPPEKAAAATVGRPTKKSMRHWVAKYSISKALEDLGEIQGCTHAVSQSCVWNVVGLGLNFGD
jgi:hypothetical protein